MTPARTGTDGRLGRLFAVQATASASASRSTRNFMLVLRLSSSYRGRTSELGTSGREPRLRPQNAGPLNSMARSTSVCARPRCREVARTGRRPETCCPHLAQRRLLVFVFFRRDNSRNHRSCGFCGQLESSQVTGLSTGDSQVDNQGTNPGLRPQSPSGQRLSTVVHTFPTGCPQGLPPDLGTTERGRHSVVPRTFNRKSTPVHRLWENLSPSVIVHIDFHRGCPHLWGQRRKVVHRWG